MDISKTMLPFVRDVYSAISSRIRKHLREGKVRKDYLQVLQEAQSFLAMLRDLLKLASCLEAVYAETRYGRVCHRWLYAELNGVRSLTKLEPRVVVSFDGYSIKVSYDDREVMVYRNLDVAYRINQFVDKTNLDNYDEVLDKRSLLLEVFGRLKGILDHVKPDFELCIKEHRLKC